MNPSLISLRAKFNNKCNICESKSNLKILINLYTVNPHLSVKFQNNHNIFQNEICPTIHFFSETKIKSMGYTNSAKIYKLLFDGKKICPNTNLFNKSEITKCKALCHTELQSETYYQNIGQFKPNFYSDYVYLTKFKLNSESKYIKIEKHCHTIKCQIII